mmetsp:Transcript_22100/g.33742  ORF Transcript_22100/g.33742 Transcript_22100/m.33742 type:complete len:269 (+) Transcript_22100:331-1137(+)
MKTTATSTNSNTTTTTTCWFGLAAAAVQQQQHQQKQHVVPTMDRLDVIDDDCSIDTDTLSYTNTAASAAAAASSIAAMTTRTTFPGSSSSTDSLMSTATSTCTSTSNKQGDRHANNCSHNNVMECDNNGKQHASDSSLQGLYRSRMRRNSVHLSSLGGSDDDLLLQTPTRAPDSDPMLMDGDDDDTCFLDCLTISEEAAGGDDNNQSDDNADPWGHFVDVFHASSSLSSSSMAMSSKQSPPRFGLLCKSKPYSSSRAPEHLRGFLSFT